VYAQLRATGKFKEMGGDADEAEHSLELHLPYIVHVMAGQPFTLVPIVVGAISAESGEKTSRDVAAGVWCHTCVGTRSCHWPL
jgi:AmmeMemoRadiSam system protein B